MFYCEKPINLKIILMVAYPEKKPQVWVIPPCWKIEPNQIKKKINGEKILILHIFIRIGHFLSYCRRICQNHSPVWFDAQKYNSSLGFSATFDVQYFQI